MMIIESIGVIRRVHSHQCTPSRVSGKIEPLFTRSESVPVNQHVFEALFGHAESSSIIHLQGKRHIMRHLRETFSSPIGVPSERTTLGIVRIEFCHTNLREISFPFHWSGEERQHGMHRIGEREVLSLSNTHLTARREIVAGCESYIGCGFVIMMRQKTHQYFLIHAQCSSKGRSILIVRI